MSADPRLADLQPAGFTPGRRVSFAPVLNIRNVSWRALFIAGLAVYTVAAVASQGYYQSDEHFQVLEFAGYKLGVTPAADLPWEFAARIRPAIQPAIAVGVVKALHLLGSTNPFTAVLLLRLASGWLAVFAFARLSRKLAPEFAGEATAKLLLAAAILVWFAPYLSVRFSSENWSALAFLFGVSLLPLSRDANEPPQHFLLAGVCLGMSFMFRFQIGFALVGIAAWLVFLRSRWTDLAQLVAGGALALVVGVAADRWFYGELVFTPWRYFQSNILLGKAAEFGVSPWWYYLPAFIVAALPPVSLVLLGFAIAGAVRRPKHALTWALACFVLGHTLVGHKEFRFLFPMMFSFLWLAVTGWDGWRPRHSAGRVWRIGAGICVTINVMALVYVCIRPANKMAPAWHVLYDYARDHHATLYAEWASPYSVGILHEHFYNAPDLPVVVTPHLDSLTTTGHAQPRVGDLLMRRHLAPAPSLPGLRVERIYRSVPDWVLRFNINHWEQRTEIWSIYRVVGAT